MRKRLFTPREPPADIRVKPPDYKPDPELSLKHDDLYARAWEYNYEQPIFDAENNNAVPTNSQEIPVSPEIFPQTDEVSDLTVTYPHMEPEAKSSSEQPENSPTNPRSSKYNLRHNPKPNCNDD